MAWLLPHLCFCLPVHKAEIHPLDWRIEHSRGAEGLTTPEIQSGGFSGQLPPRQCPLNFPLAPETGQLKTSLHKRQQTDPKLLCESPTLQFLKGNWHSELQTLSSDLTFGAEGPPVRSSSSAQWHGFTPAAIPPWEHIPTILSSLVLSLLRSWPWKYCSAWRGRCPGGTLPLWSPRSSPLKSQTVLLKKPSTQTGAGRTSQHIQSSWNGQWRAGKLDAVWVNPTHKLDNQPTDFFCLCQVKHVHRQDSFQTKPQRCKFARPEPAVLSQVTDLKL